MKLLRSGAFGVLLYVAIPAALVCLVLIFSDNEAGRMASTYDDLSQKISVLEARLENLTSTIATAAEPVPPPPIPSKMPPVKVEDTIKTSDVETTLEMESDVNKIPLEFFDQALSPSDMLADKLNLVSQDFKVPQGLEKRVAFWFDVYTKYSSHFVLLHDSRHPWIVYRVVDLREIYGQNVNRFTQDANDKRLVSKEKTAVRAILYRLARKTNFRHLSEEEYKVYKVLEEVPGPRRKVFAQAAHGLREQRGQKDFYRKGLISSSRYLTEMEQIFASYDLPVELVRLPLVESSFNLEAQSKVGASGIWQFMLGTGKKYLRVGRIADERNSPIKSTEAAAKLMLSNFRTTHSWPMAITAYNHGAGGVVHACRRFHTNNIADLVNNYHSRSFSFASQNFYSEFLAALYGEKYQDQIFGSMPKFQPLASESIDLRYSMRAKTLTDIVGMTVEELKLFNPDLKAQAIAKSTFLPVGYHIHLPLGRKARLELFYQQADEARAIVGSLHVKNSRSQGHG